MSSLRDVDPDRRAPARLARRRLRPGTVCALGLGSGFAWAFYGSLVLGLGSRPVGRGVAFTWLVVECAIGAITVLALATATTSGAHR